MHVLLCLSNSPGKGLSAIEQNDVFRKNSSQLQCLFVEIRFFIRQMEYTPTELNKLPILLQESETSLTVA